MNWSVYSKFVGNVFGAPLAIEGLAAFMLEATFLGLWIFGWNRLSPRLHLATIWIVVLGTWLSAYFILVANSWMQHPVGYKIVNGEAQLTSVWALLSNGFALRAYLHTMLAGLIFGSIVMLGVCCWHFLRGRERRPVPSGGEAGADRRGAGDAAAAGGREPLRRGGHERAEHEDRRLRGAVGHCQPCGFSLFQIGGFTTEDQTPSFSITIPRLLSYMATGSFDGQVQGLNQLQAAGAEQLRPRQLHAERAGGLLVDAGDGLRGRADVPGRRRRGVALLEAKLERARWFLWTAIVAIALPYIAATAGWILTEMGRQPWIVQGCC